MCGRGGRDSLTGQCSEAVILGVLMALAFSVFKDVYKRQDLSAPKRPGFASLFFVGITVGRALCGFLTLKFDDTQMVRMGQGIDVYKRQD